MQKKITQIIGVLGTILCIGIFIHAPSWPTPDKLLIFATFVFMIFGQGWAVLKRLAPFVGLLLVYESFRGLAPHLNKHVHFTELIAADRWLFFGRLPTKILQNWLWHGHVQWYDFVLYLVYMMHFILPLSLALLIWKTREKYYWRYVATFVATSFAGFLTFLIYPAAPPWMAAQQGLIEPITRISSSVWYALGIHDFPSVYNKISPNPVAAMPSLHAAYATLFFLFVYKLYGKKWALAASLYPLLIYLGTIYQGEHYLVDELAGALLAVIAFFAIPIVAQKLKNLVDNKIRGHFH
jgi:membrane-associated phospholipid phosphatase